MRRSMRVEDAPMIADEAVVAPSYGYTYTAMGDEPGDAPLLVRIVVTDAAGNASETTLDFNRSFYVTHHCVFHLRR